MTPSPTPIRLEIADARFRLSAAERASVSPIFDPEALERLLARVRPDVRQEIFAQFQMRRGKNLGRIVEINDPELQPMLEEVWAPAWDSATDQEVEDDVYGLPGREVVKERRARARQSGNKANSRAVPGIDPLPRGLAGSASVIA